MIVRFVSNPGLSSETFETEQDLFLTCDTCDPDPGYFDYSPCVDSYYAAYVDACARGGSTREGSNGKSSLKRKRGNLVSCVYSRACCYYCTLQYFSPVSSTLLRIVRSWNETRDLYFATLLDRKRLREPRLNPARYRPT